ncbi:craniofacial development protein 2-like [Schistocerca cancellata]|uniref:craniofacial development protein 2-like n=1 Tax=Schistocerca cancellata TaxID=274614 RepID=UPI002117C020|nr:craniofacial development protein 2-like [Schistocerca cancellata]
MEKELKVELFTGPSQEIDKLGKNVSDVDKAQEEMKDKLKNVSDTGKVNNVIQEMKRLKINILGVSETRWPDSGEMTIDNMKVYYSGNSDSQHRNGVGIILDEYASKSAKSILPISDRVISLHLQTKQTNINLIQIYAPTADKDQEEIGKFYEELTQAIGTSKSRDIIIIMGDFNAKIGEGSEGDLIGPFGLGTRNERGDLLSQFCQENNLCTTNTFFKLPKRRLYTWKSPRDCNEEVCRNQIDFILINKRYKTSIHGVKTYPGADIFSDHNPLVAKFHVKLKAIQKKQKKDYINTTILRDPLTKQKTSEEINKELVRIKNNQTEDIDGKWELIKDTLNNAYLPEEVQELSIELNNLKLSSKFVQKNQERINKDVNNLMERADLGVLDEDITLQQKLYAVRSMSASSVIKLQIL